MTVYLVGAGPGDPGLLTVRAAELLARAETVVHDRLVDPRVLALAGSDAALVDVGKRPGASSSATQASINALLVEHGSSGGVVVRLKGGDPYVFGRGGEEALALEAAGLAYEVVPGVSAALAAASCAGVPLTHRSLSSSFAVVTGHGLTALATTGDGGEAGEEDRLGQEWDALGRSAATIVVLMGAARRDLVAARLLAAGRSADTPVVVVERAATSTQRTIRTTLANLGGTEVEAPATIVVGAVAALSLASYEDRPLFGRTIVVTRALSQSGPLVDLLRSRGASVLELATRETAEALDGGVALREAVGRLGSFEWVVVASANAVERLWRELHDARDLGSVRIAAAGPATASSLARHGVLADLVADPGVGRGAAGALLELFPRPGGAPEGSGRVLVPRAAGGREDLLEGLRSLGWIVEAVEAYRTVRPEPDQAVLGNLAGADAVVFASPSSLDGFLEVAGLARMPGTVVTIGPSTSARARAGGVEVAAEAATPSADGLLAALVGALGAS